MPQGARLHSRLLDEFYPAARNAARRIGAEGPRLFHALMVEARPAVQRAGREGQRRLAAAASWWKTWRALRRKRLERRRRSGEPVTVVGRLAERARRDARYEALLAMLVAGVLLIVVWGGARACSSLRPAGDEYSQQ